MWTIFFLLSQFLHISWKRENRNCGFSKSKKLGHLTMVETPPPFGYKPSKCCFFKFPNTKGTFRFLTWTCFFNMFLLGTENAMGGSGSFAVMQPYLFDQSKQLPMKTEQSHHWYSVTLLLTGMVINSVLHCAFPLDHLSFNYFLDQLVFIKFYTNFILRV